MEILSLLDETPKTKVKSLRKFVRKAAVGHQVPAGHNYFSHCPRDVHGHCLPSGAQKPLPKPRNGPKPEPDKQHRQPGQAQQGTSGVSATPKGETPAEETCHVQDPYQDDNKDGIADYARVGVSVLAVPPPPTEFNCLPNLTEQERDAEKSFSDLFFKDPEVITHKYLQHIRASNPHPEHIFSTDQAKMLSNDYNPKNADEGIRLAATNIFGTIVLTTANAIAKRAFIKYLDEVVMELPKKKRIILATSGGVGSGKTSTIKQSIPDKMSAVWDASGELNAIENPWIFAECKRRGIKSLFVFVYTDPIKTWQMLLTKSEEKGHMTDARLFADSHTIGATNFHAFQKRYGEGTECIIIDRSSDSPQEVKSIPMKALQLSQETLYKQVFDILIKGEGKYSPSVMRGGIIGARIWGEPKEEKNEVNPQKQIP